MNEHVKRLSDEASSSPRGAVELMDRINLTLLDHQAGIDAAWDEEIERRIDAYRRGEVKAYTWEEIVERRARRGHPVS
jgi:putative addiction module component (TIGR02574 family)